MTVFIGDAHARFRGQLRQLLEAAGYEVVGEAADGASAIAAVLELRPALVMLDVQLPDMDGFDVAERLAEQAGDTAVVIVSSRKASDYRTRLARRPALRFLSKADLSAPTLAAVLEAAP
jgi:DNA-binding NarL/FixJ family response regulator